MVLVNCPFGTLAQHDRALVCGMNLEFVTGMTQGLGLDDLEVALDPAADRCCVTLRSRTT
jgi:predicted ArsR family transcriptional regulator